MQQTNQTVLTPSRDSSGAVLAALKAAFPQTIPVLTGYFVLGLGYGICCWAAFRPSLPF